MMRAFPETGGWMPKWFTIVGTTGFIMVNTSSITALAFGFLTEVLLTVS